MHFPPVWDRKNHEASPPRALKHQNLHQRLQGTSGALVMIPPTSVNLPAPVCLARFVSLQPTLVYLSKELSRTPTLAMLTRQ